MKKMKDNFLITLLACLLIILSLVIIFSNYESSKKPAVNDDLILNKNKKDQIQCTMEAKLCPDGSYVGRSGKNCEFAPCPTSRN